VLSGRGLSFGLITPLEVSYPKCDVSECEREASTIRRPWPTGGCCSSGKKTFRETVQNIRTQRICQLVTYTLYAVRCGSLLMVETYRRIV
jgi:hypothetical protein